MLSPQSLCVVPYVYRPRTLLGDRRERLVIETKGRAAGGQSYTLTLALWIDQTEIIYAPPAPPPISELGRFPQQSQHGDYRPGQDDLHFLQNGEIRTLLR